VYERLELAARRMAAIGTQPAIAAVVSSARALLVLLKTGQFTAKALSGAAGYYLLFAVGLVPWLTGLTGQSSAT
jgi:peptidoglycan biosynthesis protein MviN/MurJ (putative lipid II flippase)